jgi:hypothetical protein
MPRKKVDPTTPLGRWIALGQTDGPSLVVRVEDDVDGFPAWRSVLDFIAVDGHLVLSGIAVIPACDRRQWLAQHPDASLDELQKSVRIGEWSEDPSLLTDVGAGIPARLIRSLRISPATDEVVAYLRHQDQIVLELSPFTPVQWRRSESEEWMRAEQDRPRSVGRGPLFHANWAARYVEARGLEPHRPAVAMAKLYGITPKQAQYHVQQARNHQMLTGAVQGRAGGRLTDKAMKLLGLRGD